MCKEQLFVKYFVILILLQNRWLGSEIQCS